MKFKFGVQTIITSITLVAGMVVGTLTFSPAIADNLSAKNNIPTPVYEKNKNGQTYGSSAFANTPDQIPDLISAIGVDGTEGYILATDFNGDQPKSPAEAVEHNKKLKPERKIPLYAVDGKTVIGEFKVQNGKLTDTPNNVNEKAQAPKN